MVYEDKVDNFVDKIIESNNLQELNYIDLLTIVNRLQERILCGYPYDREKQLI